MMTQRHRVNARKHNFKTCRVCRSLSTIGFQVLLQQRYEQWYRRKRAKDTYDRLWSGTYHPTTEDWENQPVGGYTSDELKEKEKYSRP